MSFMNLINTQASTSKSLFQSVVTMSKRTAIMGRWKPYPQKRAPKPREERATRSKTIADMTRQAIENDDPHFTTGGKKIYFPGARVCLLRPNANHTPYQAKFIVPKSFNKLDLRDYLYNIYGLRVLNVTVALTPAKFERALPAPYRTRYRSPQIKKMTVDLMEPFVWPEVPEHYKEEQKFAEELRKYADDKQSATNSDKEKPSEAFGGILTPNPRPLNFVPKRVQKHMKRTVLNSADHYKQLHEEALIEKYLNI